MKHLSLLIAGAALASTAEAQTVRNYWNFESNTELIEGVPTMDVGTPDLSIHPTYGEAYPGSGKSLNITFNVQSYLIADVHDGANPTALDFGTNDFSFSYWSYDDTSDGNTKGPRIFDFLDGTVTGVQLGTTATNQFNLRVDTDDGGATISNNTLTTLMMPSDTWVHVAVNVDRGGNQLEIFFDGASQGTVALAAPSAGGVYATRDMDIGVINSDGTQNQAEQSGLDDLAFYDGLLTLADIAGLANGSLTPLNFGFGAGTAYCFGDGSGTACPCGNAGGAGEGCANSTGSGATLVGTGTSSISAADLVLEAANALPNQPGLFFQGEVATNGGMGVPFGDGLRCAGTNVVRLQTVVPDGNGDAMTSIDIADKGGVSAGDTRYYQYWYRNPTNSPCGANFNLTNGYEITWSL